ncbi:hypothetical protein BDZ94DRAFT_1303976 [Collybia nuda]|uniref:Uncharacterized protein n=1 Tax=Collybia nuda TaxID=64659 RepID=A0A9P5YJ66_9AGAR|nr:hypothetical protein BDZ94DRAFT_1303976 [Collybia nuda]
MTLSGSPMATTYVIGLVAIVLGLTANALPALSVKGALTDVLVGTANNFASKNITMIGITM